MLTYVNNKIRSILHFNLSLNMSCRGKSPITDRLIIPTPSHISVTIRDIKK